MEKINKRCSCPFCHSFDIQKSSEGEYICNKCKLIFCEGDGIQNNIGKYHKVSIRPKDEDAFKLKDPD